jgi:hypothetical protein
MTGMGDVIDISHVSLWMDIDRIRPPVDDPWGCFKKVLILFNHFREKEQR